MLEKLIEEIAEIIADILDVVFGKTVHFVIDTIVDNTSIVYLIDSMLKLTVLILALTFVITLLTHMMNETKKEVIGLIARFIVLSTFSFFVYDFAIIFFRFAASTSIKYIVIAVSQGLAEDFFVLAFATIQGVGVMSVINLVNMVLLLVMFCKFLFDLGKYAIQTQVLIFTYPIYAVNALANGWTELWNWILGVIKVIISVVLVSMYLSFGMYMVLSAIDILDPLEGFGKLIVGIILMGAKKPIETSLGKLGLFNSGSNIVHTVSSGAMLARSTVGLLAR